MTACFGMTEVEEGSGIRRKRFGIPSFLSEISAVCRRRGWGLFEDTLDAKMLFESHGGVDINESDVTHPYCFDFMMTMGLGIPYSINLGKENEKVYRDMAVEVSSSFENLLFQCAAEKYERLYFSSCEMIQPRIKFADLDYAKQGRRLFLIIDRIAKENGLCRAWFSDDSVYFAYSDEMSLFINSRDYGVLGMISYDKKEKVEDIKKSLESNVDAIIYQ